MHEISIHCSVDEDFVGFVSAILLLYVADMVLVEHLTTLGQSFCAPSILI